MEELAKTWSKLTLSEAIEPADDARSLGVTAKGYFVVVGRHLLALSRSPQDGTGSAVRCGALALELSARVWQAFGPAAGRRHLHLWHRLEDKLAATDREIRAGELPARASRASVPVATRRACAAIDGLLAGEADLAEALEALEDAAIDIAALAVRIVLNWSEVGGARRGVAIGPAALERDMTVLVSEVSGAARLAAGRRSGSEDHVGGWLSAALAIAPPTQAIELSARASADPCLRRDALFALRARWLELAGALWGAVQKLDELLAIATFDDDARLQHVLTVRAERQLVACELWWRPGAFDHEEAWRRQHKALRELVSDVCVALESRGPDAVVRSQQLAVRRLTRALPAIWVIDECVRLQLEPAGGGGI